VSRLATVERRIRKRIASNVRRQREKAELTLEEVAHRAGMHWRHWQKVEAGEVNATLKTLARLSDALGVDPAELLKPEARP
jgi:transcriptional regulator with XRE-family HTH domain